MVGGVGLDIYDVAKAPPAKKAHVAVHDTGSLAGGLAGAAYGAEIGSAFGPAGTIVGGLVGGVIGSGAGGMVADAAEKTWNTFTSRF